MVLFSPIRLKNDGLSVMPRSWGSLKIKSIMLSVTLTKAIRRSTGLSTVQQEIRKLKWLSGWAYNTVHCLRFVNRQRERERALSYQTSFLVRSHQSVHWGTRTGVKLTRQPPLMSGDQTRLVLLPAHTFFITVGFFREKNSLSFCKLWWYLIRRKTKVIEYNILIN